MHNKKKYGLVPRKMWSSDGGGCGQMCANCVLVTGGLAEVSDQHIYIYQYTIVYLYQHIEIYNNLSVNYVYYIYTVGWDVGPTYNLSRPNLPAYVYTQTCSNMIFDASGKYTRQQKQEVLEAHPFKTLPAKIDKHIW